MSVWVPVCPLVLKCDFRHQEPFLTISHWTLLIVYVQSPRSASDPLLPLVLLSSDSAVGRVRGTGRGELPPIALVFLWEADASRWWRLLIFWGPAPLWKPSAGGPSAVLSHGPLVGTPPPRGMSRLGRRGSASRGVPLPAAPSSVFSPAFPRPESKQQPWPASSCVLLLSRSPQLSGHGPWWP